MTDDFNKRFERLVRATLNGPAIPTAERAAETRARRDRQHREVAQFFGEGKQLTTSRIGGVR